MRFENVNITVVNGTAPTYTCVNVVSETGLPGTLFLQSVTTFDVEETDSPLRTSRLQCHWERVTWKIARVGGACLHASSMQLLFTSRADPAKSYNATYLKCNLDWT